MGFAEAVTAGNERNRLFVIHRHAGEGLADVARRGQRIRFSVGAFRVHVNQAHLHRGQGIRQIAIAAVALVRQPLAFGTPVDVLTRLPNVLPSAGEAKGLEAHRLQRDVAGENHEIGPGDFLPIFLLDRPQQAARLIEVHVVRPAIEGRKTLFARACSAAAVADAVGARAVPGHTNEEWSVVAEIGWPPLLRVRHQGAEIFDHGIQIEALEFLRVIELLAHGIGLGRVLVQNVYVEMIRPPVGIAL